MEEFLNSSKEPSTNGHVLTGEGDDLPEEAVEMEPTLVEEDEPEEVFVEA